MHIKLLIGSSDETQCAKLAREIDRQFGSYVTCRATDLAGVAACAADDCPDILLLDNTPGTTGLRDVLSQVRSASPATRTFLLFHACAQELVIESLKEEVPAGADEDGTPPQAEALRTIHAGEIWFGRGALLHAFRSLVRVARATHLVDNGLLTRREGEIMHLVGAGLSNKEMARRLAISDKTVKTHLHRIYVKLHQSGRYKAFLSQLPAPAAEDGLASQGGESGHGAPAHLY